jgi:lipopolysaccharide export system permease protein
MTRLDWIVLRRVAGRVLLTLVIFFGLFCLVESLDSWRFNALSKIGGPQLGVLAIVSNAGRAIIGALPVIVLIGAIIGVLDLQARRELTIIKATGVSIWRVMRAPLAGAVILGLFAAFVGDTVAIDVSRSLPILRGNTDTLWLEQHGKDGDYILRADHPHANGTVLDGVSIFFVSADNRDRIQAQSATLGRGEWVLTDAVHFRADQPPESFETLGVPTRTTPGDMRIRLTSARDLTFAELWPMATGRVADPELRATAITSLLRLLATPALLCGSVLIAFAFTSGYRRTNKYGGAVLYGIVLGFVVYVVTELANRSGFAGVLDPTFAAAGPAFVAIIIGLTVLLYREDGRA